MPKKGQIGIYIHWPFCLAKCPYCDFNSYVSKNRDETRWCAAYIKALEHYAARTANQDVISVFFGGGTPSLMPQSTVQAITDTIYKLWHVSPDVEITLEANPTSVEISKFKDFRAAGINRVSLGVQSLNDDDLKFLGREHSAKEAVKAIEVAAQTFERYSFDLIYARPGQTLGSWEQELKQALPLARGHMSLYQLTIERSTPFYMDHAQGKFTMPKDELAADFYTLTQEIMSTAGLPAYEVSNHAAHGQESRHNLIYWQYGDYIGIGPGAHGRLTQNGRKYATREHRAPELWLKYVEEQNHAAHPFTDLTPEDQFFEGLMMGLRLTGGLDLEDLSARTGTPWRSALEPEKIDTLQTQGWAEINSAHLRLSTEGLLRLNAIVPYILRDTGDQAVA